MAVAAKFKRRGRDTRNAKGRRALDQKDAEHLSDGAAAAERASAGIGTEDAEPTDWLFGEALGEDRSS
jgi:hypothetical protein